MPPGRDTLGLAVRTFVPAADADGWSEITGARCRVTGGDLFRADVVTPARLTGRGSRPRRAAAPGGLHQRRAQRRRRRGAGVRLAGGRPAGGAVHRIWWGGGWWWGFQNTGPMRYPDLAVGMH